MPNEHAEDNCVIIGYEAVGRQAALEQRHVAGAADVNEKAAVEVRQSERVGHSVTEHGAHHAGIRDVAARLVTLCEAAG